VRNYVKRQSGPLVDRLGLVKRANENRKKRSNVDELRACADVFFANFFERKKKAETVAPRKFTSETTISVSPARPKLRRTLYQN